jgi:hypothetical protein
VATYKGLNEVERGFSHLKDLLELRPVCHRSDERVQAHVFEAALALLLNRALEKSLRVALSNLSTLFAWQGLEMIRCVEVDLGKRRKLRNTRGNQHATEVLQILGISQWDPPFPPEGRQWLVERPDSKKGAAVSRSYSPPSQTCASASAAPPGIVPGTRRNLNNPCDAATANYLWRGKYCA